MRAGVEAFRRIYGSHPLHLLALIACFALFAYVIVTIKPVTLWNTHVWWQSIAVWFAAAIVIHDLVLFPAYSLVDRLLTSTRREPKPESPRLPVLNYLRVPLMGSALTLVVFLPGIIEQGARTYFNATGQTQEVFLGRWLLLTAAMFSVSAVIYAVKIATTRRMNGDNASPISSAG